MMHYIIYDSDMDEYLFEYEFNSWIGSWFRRWVLGIKTHNGVCRCSWTSKECLAANKQTACLFETEKAAEVAKARIAKYFDEVGEDATNLHIHARFNKFRIPRFKKFLQLQSLFDRQA